MADATPLKTYLDIIGKAEDQVAETWAPDDPQLTADLHDQVFMNVCQGYFHYFGGDETHPDFTPVYNNLLRLQPNPDDNYVRTHLTRIGRRELAYWTKAQSSAKAVRGIYDHFGLELSDEVAQSMRDWLAANPADKHGGHRYDLADYGLTRDEIHSALGEG